jgi:4-hydroxy-3-methylbut-2-enyl diphosphate reductase
MSKPDIRPFSPDDLKSGRKIALQAYPLAACAGVAWSIENAQKTMAAEGIVPGGARKLWGVGTLVNNNLVVEGLRRQGMVFVEKPEEVPLGEVAMISAHGLSYPDRDVLAARGLKVVDSTCPLVEVAHVRRDRHIAEASEEGLRPKVLYICKEDDLIKGHKEVVGFIKSAPDVVVPITSPDDINKLVAEPNTSYAVDTQTTLNIQEANQWIELIKEKVPGIKIPPEGDVCYATKNRQSALRAVLALNPDLMVAFGSEISSNTKQLKKIAEAAGVQTHLLETADLLTPQIVEGKKLVAITAGASAPPEVPMEAMKVLAKLGYEPRRLSVASEPTTFPRRQPKVVDYREKVI